MMILRRGMQIAAVFGAVLAVVGPVDAQTARIENEYKLTVPLELTEPVWEYLQERYARVQQLLNPLGGEFRATFADEKYIDQYFDTPDMTLLKMHGGIRHRSRFIISGEDFSKDGRELVQIKLDRPGDLVVNRTEIKFPVRTNKQVRQLSDAHPVIGLIRPNRRATFTEAVARLGINAGELAPSLRLDQRRRRVYISRDGQPFATITLDQVSTQQWMRSVRYTELEIELNEIAYTAAARADRDEMQFVNDVMKHDISRAFPAIEQDQTPKYNKAYNALSEKFICYGLARRIGMPLEIIFVACGVGFIAVGLRRGLAPGHRMLRYLKQRLKRGSVAGEGGTPSPRSRISTPH